MAGRQSVRGNAHGPVSVTQEHAESETTASSDGDTKLRPGTTVEVFSKNYERWFLAQVAAPLKEGKVTVQWDISGKLHRKTMMPDSPELRMPSLPCEEVRPAAASGRGSRGSGSLEEARQSLKDSRDKEKPLLLAPSVRERAPSASKWVRACKIAEESRSLELWGCSVESLNGVYLYLYPTEQGAGPPYFQSERRPGQWLYAAKDGSWRVGDTDSKDQRLAGGWLCSDPLEPGTSPQNIAPWKALRAGEWEVQASAHFWLSESVEVAWQCVRVLAFQTPVIEVQGTGGGIVNADGLYEFVLDDGAGHPPVFVHQQRVNVCIFLARDQRWWIGKVGDMEVGAPAGYAHSALVRPGTAPWEVREGNPPTYQSSVDPDVWLYLAADGCWWLGDKCDRDARRARGFMRSDAVEPGTLPQSVSCWRDPRGEAWEANPAVRVMRSDAVAAEWERAACALAGVEIKGTSGPAACDGYFDLLASEAGKHRPPVFKRPAMPPSPPVFLQPQEEAFLYLATDGRWWVGTEVKMRLREPGCRMRSDLARPGVLPSDPDLGWYALSWPSGEWQRVERIVVR